MARWLITPRARTPLSEFPEPRTSPNTENRTGGRFRVRAMLRGNYGVIGPEGDVN